MHKGWSGQKEEREFRTLGGSLAIPGLRKEHGSFNKHSSLSLLSSNEYPYIPDIYYYKNCHAILFQIQSISYLQCLSQLHFYFDTRDDYAENPFSALCSILHMVRTRPIFIHTVSPVFNMVPGMEQLLVNGV